MDREGDEGSFDNLPDEVLLRIFSYLPCNEVMKCSRVCRRWNKIRKDCTLKEEIDLRCNKLPLDEFSNFLASHKIPELKVLKLQKLNSYHFKSLKIFIMNAPNLRKLELIYTILTPSNQFYRSQVKFDHTFLHQNLVHLSLRGCSFDYDFTWSLSQQHFPNIQCLDIGEAQCDTYFIVHLFSAFTGIRSLYVDSCQSLSIENLVPSPRRNFLRFMKLDFTFILVLDLEHISIIAEHFVTVIRLCHNLRELYIGHTSVDDEILQKLRRRIQTLQKLCIRQTKISFLAILSVLSGMSESTKFTLYSSFCDEDAQVLQLEKTCTIINSQNIVKCKHYQIHSCN